MKKTDSEMLEEFWSANPEQRFETKYIALVLRRKPTTLKAYRWLKKGPKWSNVSGTVLYKKSDVLEWGEMNEK